MPKVNVHFYLKEPGSKDETPIYLSVSYDGYRIRWYVSEHIRPQDWNFRKEQPKALPELTHLLRRIADDTRRIIIGFRSRGEPFRPDSLKDELNRIYKGKNKREPISLLTEFMQANPTNLTASTLKTYNSLLSNLKGFVKETGFRLEFASMDSAFDERFFGYLSSKYHPNTIRRIYSNLKTWLAYMAKIGEHDNMHFREFSRKKKPTTQIALTASEMAAIESVHLAELTDQFYRDVFVFMRETAMEYSAAAGLRWSNIHRERIFALGGKEVDYAEYYRHKTRGRVTAPISKKAMSILVKYKVDDQEVCFPGMQNGTFNLALPRICKAAGIDSIVWVRKYEGQKEKLVSVPKYELVKTHTARRTFVTLFQGSDRACMVYTGHSSVLQLENYRKETDDQKLALALG